MRKTDEQVNREAYVAAFSQYEDEHHEEYESTANGFIMGYNDAVGDMIIDIDRLETQLYNQKIKQVRTNVDHFWVGLIIGVFLTMLFFVL